MHEDRHDRERWLAAGLPESMITIMFRDGTLPPPHAARWYDSGLTTAEIVEYRRTGRGAPDPAQAAALETLGVPPDADFLAAWDGLGPEQIVEAVDRGFTSAGQFAPWAGTDADIAEVELLAPLGAPGDYDAADALRLLRAGRTPAEIAFAFESGIKPKKVAAWIERQLSPSEAASWSAAGFSASKAAAWLEVVPDPTLARQLLRLGLDADTARAQRPPEGWTAHAIRSHIAAVAGASPHDAGRWAETSTPTDELAVWIRSGVAADAADDWQAHEVDPAESARWHEHGFDAAGAAGWRAAAIEPSVAARRRDAGLRPPSPPSGTSTSSS